jgi:uncharacterized protein (TIGR02246 family)
MTLRPARRVAIPFALLLLAGAIPALSQVGKPPISEDEKAIRAVDEAYVVAYNKGDGKALTALFTEDAEVIEAEGVRYKWREAIEKSYADTFAASPGVKVAFEIESIRFISPDVAREEGRTVVTPAKGAPVARLYSVLYVKRDGRWLMADVRETDDSAASPHDRLKDLEWMVGDWIDEGADAVVKLHCKWSGDGNFLLRHFVVTVAGKTEMDVNQRIGWDPVARHVRSWEFDSDGGFGEGKWTRTEEPDRWVIKHSGVTPDGLTASSTNTLSRERSDAMQWISADRVVGDESIAGSELFLLVRVPPAPGRKPNTPQTKGE